MACPASAHRDGAQVESSNPEAALGSATHEVVTGWISSGDVGVGIAATAKKWRVEESDLGGAVWSTWQAWCGVREFFPAPRVEVPMVFRDQEADIELTGTADVVSYLDDVQEIRIADFKGGRLDLDHSHQLAGYAFIGYQIFGAIRARTVAIRSRDQLADWSEFTAQDLWQWYAGLLAQFRKADVFSPGRHCGFCPRRATCSAKTALLRQSAEMLAMPLDSAISIGKEYGAMLDMIKLVEDQCHEARDLIRAEVVALGPLATGDGRRIQLEDVTRTHIDYPKARPALYDEVGPEALPGTLDVNIGRLKALVMESAPRGTKKRRWDVLMRQLDQAGAVTTTTTQQLVIRREPKQLEQEKQHDDSDSNEAKESASSGAR